MKKLLLIACLGLAFAAKAQSIQATAGNPSAKIKADGSIEINGVHKASILKNGTIVNTSKQTIGFVKEDGSIENANQVVVGYFRSNYDVYDANNNVIGHLRTNLDVKNASDVKIGKYDETIPTAWSAVAFFFLKP